jgi:hypothetical protein
MMPAYTSEELKLLTQYLYSKIEEVKNGDKNPDPNAASWDDHHVQRGEMLAKFLEYGAGYDPLLLPKWAKEYHFQELLTDTLRQIPTRINQYNDPCSAVIVTWRLEIGK